MNSFTRPNQFAWSHALISCLQAKAVVVATGANTFFGKAAAMISQVVHQGRFQMILFRITLILLAM